MAEYRLYCLTDAGNFTKAHEIDAHNDQDAVALAKALKLPNKCELWERGRMVAKLDGYL
jgi:hypothetical protein